MLGVKPPLTIILSLITILSPIATSACELSCWLGHAHSDCRSAESDPATASGVGDRHTKGPAPSTNMSSMDMGSMDMSSVDMGSPSDTRAAEYHASIAAVAMPMSRELQANFRRHPHVARSETRRIPPADRPTLHTCIRGLCGQVSVSASPPNLVHFHVGSTPLVPIGAVSLAHIFSGVPWIGTADPWHATLGSSPLTYILRI
jgi:hypothetical protein